MFCFLRSSMVFLVVLSGGVILSHPHCFAQKQGQNQDYFSLFNDIPLMQGMTELTDQSFVFDKAEGRVVESVGFLSVSETESPVKYYETVLQQLGWKPLKTGLFRRNNEQLVVRAEKVAQGVLVRFQLSPLSR
jgi:hypothetical protein